MVASLASAAPEGIHIDRLFLWEAVSKKQPAFALMKNFGHDMLAWQKYLSENPSWMHRPGTDDTMITRMASHPSAYYSYPIGMAKGHMVDDLTQAREREAIDAHTEVIVLNGSESHVSPTGDNEKLTSLIRTLGIKATYHEVYLGESHGMIDSSQRMSAALKPYF